MSAPTKRVSSHSKQLQATVAALAIGVLLAFVILEAGLRIFQPFPMRMRGDQILLPRNVTYKIHNTSPKDFAGVLDENLIHTKNSLGFRGPEPPATFGNALTIVTVGGSTTECFFLADGDDWPARLAAHLSVHFHELWLNNAGLDGHSTFGHLQLMRQYISDLHPKFVTILAGINDMFADGPNRYDKAPIESAVSDLARYSDVAALALSLWRHEKALEIRDLGAMPRPINLHDSIYHTLKAAPGQSGAIAPKEVSHIDAYRGRLMELVNLARSSGIEPILITQPALFGPAIDDITGINLADITVELDSALVGAQAWAALEAYNDAMREVGSKMSVSVVDLARLMPKSSRYYYDFFHFTKAGAVKVASILDRQICPIVANKAPQYMIEGAQCSD